MQFLFLPPGAIALQHELSSGYHKTICSQMKSIRDFSERLGTLAAHVNVELDGDYTNEDLDELCGLIAARLQNVREYTTNIFLPNG